MGNLFICMTKKESKDVVRGGCGRSQRKLVTRTIPSPSLPLELVEEEILSRLPVKILLQLRCICKSWKSLISNDPRFAKKHLRMSKILKQQQHLLIVVNDFRCHNLIFWDSPLSSVFNNSTVTQTQLNLPISFFRHSDYIRFKKIWDICSCDGILCFILVGEGGRKSVVLCNPSLRKYSELPPLENHRTREYSNQREVPTCLYSFGYDHFNDVFKVIAITCGNDKNKVDVYTLGTNNWRSIQDFPCSSFSMYYQGVFVGGTVNWVGYEKVPSSSYGRVIVSLDLKTELYGKISHPDDLEKDYWDLGMFRDCLCIFASVLNQNPRRYNPFLDIWIMKEYGIKESWIKLYSVPYVENQYTSPKTVYICDDDQVLFHFYDLINHHQPQLAVYNSKNGNVKIPKIQHINSKLNPKVYVESLISLP